MADSKSKTPDPVLFGPDPFSQQPGWEPPAEDTEPSDLPRPKWPVIATIVILVVILVGAMGIWVF
ncbi:MAG: hypothetical protein GEV28_01505 [Actinophytocola sp.]|uniref:hypothetical protein n=1 Tax=Actinophytocola sp. TaxID=1872138 RepID=UPI0013247584|nr:hypothetical protein [Actinophytocola sp.]MPZ79131.1 hypothetical protein [Actinophytocola sp.]